LTPARETLIGACIERAALAIIRENLAAGRDPKTPATRRETGKALWQATRLGSGVAALIVEWALALDDAEHDDQFGIEAFAAWSATSRRTIYRRVDDFRRCFPDHDTPNAIALDVLTAARARGENPRVQTLVAA
jgi:hypothetical protein